MAQNGVYFFSACSDGGAYTNVRRALNEYGLFEEIIQDGVAQAQGDAVAILASESSNYWLRNAGTQGAAKRTLYIMLKHGGYPVDFLLEEDCVAGRLKFYNALFVSDAQVSEVATKAIEAWVEVGGTVVATAGAFAQNEFNMTSVAAQSLLSPLNQTALFVGNKNACPNGVQDHRCRTTRVQLAVSISFMILEFLLKLMVLKICFQLIVVRSKISRSWKRLIRSSFPTAQRWSDRQASTGRRQC